MTPPAPPPDLSPHRLKLALVHPQIAPNTGNIARLCVATGTELHLVRPLGFVLSDRELKRSAMDYWPRLRLTVHDDLDPFLSAMNETPKWFFSTKGERSVWDADFHDGDVLIFGNENQGLPDRVLDLDPSRVIRIPQAPNERCVNLSTAAGIGLFEALRQVCIALSPLPPGED
jgi:tRNA (cytidine/uridine-2'-O-)-methyltransferase